MLFHGFEHWNTFLYISLHFLVLGDELRDQIQHVIKQLLGYGDHSFEGIAEDDITLLCISRRAWTWFAYI